VLKVGFIGLGFISNENVLGYLNSNEATIVAACDTDEEKTAQWLKRWRLEDVRSYRRCEDMLEKESLDIVEILTPQDLHCPQAVACAEAGVKGISLQKPMATSLSECDQIIRACDENNVILKVYENFIFYPVYLKAKELIEGGLIGDLMSIRVNTMAGLRDGAPWPWLWSPGSWRMDPKRTGVGPVVGDDGHHKFSLARWFMGRDFEKVSAWIDPETPLDAPAMVRARFKRRPGDGPKFAQFDFSFSPRMALPCGFWMDEFLEIVGERGIMWTNQCTAGGDREMFNRCMMSLSPAFPPIAVFLDGNVTTFCENMSPEQCDWSTSFVGCTRHFIDVRQWDRVTYSKGAD
jgi:predicted dehydrogenase